MLEYKNIISCFIIALFVFSHKILEPKKNTPIPIIFLHKGDSNYLKDIFKQVIKFNNVAILLGDNKNNHYENIIHQNISNFLLGADEFKEHYIHASPNSYDYEIFCFQRWFILRDFMNFKNISKCFYCDSDMKIYFNANTEALNFNQYDAAFLYPEIEPQKVDGLFPNSTWQLYGGMISFWTLKGINDFCDFLLDHFKNKKTKINKWANIGFPLSPLIDMLLFKEWSLLDKKTKKTPINKIINNSTFDLSLYLSENCYEMTKNFIDRENIPAIKKIKMKNGIPYVYNTTLKKNIRFKSLHFQRSLKKLINVY